MATDLTGLKVKDTYNSLLKIGDNSSLSATPDKISDGLGNESILYLSTSQVSIGTLPATGYDLTVNSAIKTGSIDIVGAATAATLRLTGGSGSQGTLSWNTDEETVDIIQNGATLQVGQEVQVHVKNQTGSTISDGTPVYVTGTLGSSGRLTVAPMIADGTIEAKYFLGITTEDIPNGEDGKVTTFGKIRGLDTSSYSEGQTLYVSDSTAGAFQTTAPVAPNLDLEVAIVINVSANNGTIFVRAQNGHYLGLLHDVYLNNPANNQFLVYNSTTSRWENQGIASVGSINLDSVTDNGNTTTNDISVGNITSSGNRNIVINSSAGSIRINGSSGGWSNGYFFNNSAGTFVGGYGMLGGGESTTYFWIGDNYNDASVTIEPNQGDVNIIAGNLKLGGTTVIDSSRNITANDISAGNMTLSGYLRGAANFVIDPAAYGDETGVVQILGDLRVDGTTTTINSTTVTIDDKNIVLASGSATAADANGAGLTIDGANAVMAYNSTSDRFVFNKNIQTNLVGNADTATLAITSYTLAYEDNRTISPSELSANRLKFGFTSWNNNNTSPYADFLHLRSYQDATGGYDNLIMFRKNADPAMRIWTQSWGSTNAYSNYVDVITSATTFGGDVSGTYDNLQVANDSHTHDLRYYTKTESDDLFVDVSGDTMTGNLTVGDGTADNIVSVYYSDNSYTEVRGYGVLFSRGSSYLRPMVDGTQTLYVGAADASLDWQHINFKFQDTIQFNQNGTVRLQIDTGGNTDIKTGNLEIGSTTTIDANRNMYGLSATYTGSVVIGTTSFSSHKLTVNGAGVFYGDVQYHLGANSSYYVAKSLGTTSAGPNSGYGVYIILEKYLKDDESTFGTIVGTRSGNAGSPFVEIKVRSFCDYTQTEAGRRNVSVECDSAPFNNVEAKVVTYNGNDYTAIFIPEASANRHPNRYVFTGWHTQEDDSLKAVSGDDTNITAVADLTNQYPAVKQLYSDLYVEGSVDITTGTLDVGGSTVIDASRNIDVTSATVKGLLNLTTAGAELQVGGIEVIDASRNITAASLTTDSITGGTIDINGTTAINLQYNGSTQLRIDQFGVDYLGTVSFSNDGISLTDEDSTIDSFFHANIDYSGNQYTVTSNARYGADYIQVDGLDSREETRFVISPKDIGDPDPHAFLYIGGDNSITAPNTLVDWHTIEMNALLVKLNANLNIQTGGLLVGGVSVINSSRNITGNSFIKSGGTSSEFLKADGSVDSNTYLTTESDTLQSVTNRGATTTNSITVGGTSSGALDANKQGIVIEGTGGQVNAPQDGTEKLPTLQFYDSVTDYGSNTATIGEIRGGVEWYTSEASSNYPAISGAIYSVNENTYNTKLGLAFYTNYNTTSPIEVMRVEGGGNINLLEGNYKINGSTVIDASRNFYVPDNSQIRIGSASDLLIYHDGNNSYIQDNGTGELRINSDNAVRIRKHDNETMALFTANGSASLWYDNSLKIETNSSGVGISGTATASLFTGPKASFGSSGTTRIAIGLHTMSFESYEYPAILSNNHADLSLASNLKIDSNHDMFVINTHATMKGAGIVLGGNGHPNGTSTINFFAKGSGSATAGDTYTAESAEMVLSNTQLSLDVDLKLDTGNTLIIDTHSGFEIDLIGTGGGNIRAANSDLYLLSQTANTHIGASGTNGLFVVTSGTSYFTNNVGINQTNANADLDVQGTALIGSGTSTRADRGLTLVTDNSNTFSADSDLSDTNRQFTVINDNATIGAYSAVSLRVHPSTGTAMADIKLVRAASLGDSTLYTTIRDNSGNFQDIMEVRPTSVTVNGSLTATSFSGNGSSLTSVNASQLGGYGISSILSNGAGEYIVNDTRSVETSTDLGNRSVRFDFKQNATDGLSDGGTYHGTMTFQQWNDSSGGKTHTLAFTDNGNLYNRTGTIGGSWGDYYLIHSDVNSGRWLKNGSDIYFSTGNVFVGGTTTSNLQGWGRQIASINSGSNGAALTLKDSNGEWQLASYQDTFRLTKGAVTTMKVDSSAQTRFYSSTDYSIGLTRNGNDEWWLKAYTNGTFALHENGVGDQFTILAGGNAGIGTTNPLVKLSLGGGVGQKLNVYESGNTRIGLGADIGGSGHYGLSLYTNVSMTFGKISTSDGSTFTEFARFNSSGNLGIGTKSPSATLQVGSGTTDANIRSYYSDGTYTEMRGYGLYFSRTASYLRPTVNGTHTMYFGGSSNYWGSINTYSNTHTWYQNGSAKMRLNSTGLGIGLTNPAEQLSVQGDTGLYGTTSGGIITPANLTFYSDRDAEGIGNASKHSLGVIKFEGKDSSLNAAGVYSSIESYIIDANTAIQGSANEGGQLEFNIWRHDVSAQPRVKYTAMTIDNYGRVGINDTSPSYSLDVNGTINSQDFIRVGGNSKSGTEIAPYNQPNATSVNLGTLLNDYGFIDIASSNANGGWIDFSYANGTDYRGRIRYNNSGDAMYFYAAGSGSPTMTIGNGRIGINNTSPSTNYSLDIAGRVNIDNGTSNALRIDTAVFDNTTRDAIELFENDAQATGRQAISWYNANQAYYKARLWTEVGSSYGATKFGIDVANDARTVATRLYIEDGDTYVSGKLTASNDVIAFSDARVKENIETIDNALDKVLAMRGVSYNRTDQDDKSKKVGVIAQEIEQVLPEVVTEDGEGMKGVAYGNIVGVLIEAMKEQQKQIEELKAIINGGS